MKSGMRIKLGVDLEGDWIGSIFNHSQVLALKNNLGTFFTAGYL